MRPPQYLGGGTAARALGEAPVLASHQEAWTIQVDSQRANGATSRRNDPRTEEYSDNAWYELDIPFGWIPAEIGNLAVYVTELSSTAWVNRNITVVQAPPAAWDAAAPSALSLTNHNFYVDPGFIPFYCRPGSMPNVTSISWQDASAYLNFRVKGKGRGLPHMLTGMREESASLGSWPLRFGSPRDPDGLTPAFQSFHPGVPGQAVCQIENPSGGTLRFEQRLCASDAMPSIYGRNDVEGLGLPSIGWPAWRVTISLIPVRSVQYGGVAVAPEGQFVG